MSDIVDVVVMETCNDPGNLIAQAPVGICISNERFRAALNRVREERDAEIATLKSALDTCVAANNRWSTINKELKADKDAEIARLREDANRLDFLEAEATNDSAQALFRQNMPITRAAIDAALAAKEPPV